MRDGWKVERVPDHIMRPGGGARGRGKSHYIKQILQNKEGDKSRRREGPNPQRIEGNKKEGKKHLG